MSVLQAVTNPEEHLGTLLFMEEQLAKRVPAPHPGVDFTPGNACDRTEAAGFASCPPALWTWSGFPSWERPETAGVSC